MSTFHMGRSWAGTMLEDTCPCPKAACGLIADINIDPACGQHAPRAAKTMRQGHEARSCTKTSPEAWAAEQLLQLGIVIDYMEATDEDSWQIDTVRSADGTSNCFFGHLFSMGGDDEHGSALWNTFEELWATTYVIYPVNDGTNPKYPQDTPKQRILAFLRALQCGDELNTYQGMEAEFAAHEAERAASSLGA